jgi:hypothetical protein
MSEKCNEMIFERSFNKFFEEYEETKFFDETFFDNLKNMRINFLKRFLILNEISEIMNLVIL